MLREIVVNVTLFSDTRRGPHFDNIADCGEDAQVAKEIRALVEGARRFAVEALAEDIASLYLSMPGVQKVTIIVEKPGAESVGVETERGN